MGVKPAFMACLLAIKESPHITLTNTMLIHCLRMAYPSFHTRKARLSHNRRDVYLLL